ncbi:hypothetical protein MUB16_03000 [Priestia sp. OVL9]|uniref:hypothetical protein n=1 Tax=Priestia aryabhattai TaxID=412384 RepID=UPI001ADB9F34|nr:hypothetical protein [Priestia aryabhattai]MCJ7983451.1 hypothetical protein [Priestia sp. OVL9]QTL52565.1 hypothetical protein J5Z55_29385 [Priestia aryabhattai]
MEIMVGQNYKITSDALNIILNKKYLKKDKQGNVTTEGVSNKSVITPLLMELLTLS